MTIHLVQLTDGHQRRVALVEEPELVCLNGVTSVYELCTQNLDAADSLSNIILNATHGERLSYDDVYSGRSPWRLLSPIDVPGAPEKLVVSGTGLTHLGSAKDRQAMHLQTAHDAAKPVTDSMRMFQWGLEGGRPESGKIGIPPEWFYKGAGTVVRGPFEALDVPSHAEDGGEEAEIAGIYLIAPDGTPVRVGLCSGNEFSDHLFERRNYLNLAGSKLRSCSIGPELVIGADFRNVQGTVSIERAGGVIWSKSIETGEDNMAHSLSNLEHHHFKFEGHRIPGHVHVHFFGAHSLSFGEGLTLEDGDWMAIQFAGYGRALRNPVKRATAQPELIRVRTLS